MQWVTNKPGALGIMKSCTNFCYECTEYIDWAHMYPHAFHPPGDTTGGMDPSYCLQKDHKCNVVY